MGAADSLSLQSHDATPAGAVQCIAAQLRRADAATLACHFQLRGDLAQVRIPGARAGRRADELWQHTCFEVFLNPAGADSYFEFNFSPALDWAAYRFDSYRSGMQPANLAQGPGLNVRRSARQLDLSATVHLAGLAELTDCAMLRVALTAVVEASDGQLSYWSLHHAAGRPDFHHPVGFAHLLGGP